MERFVQISARHFELPAWAEQEIQKQSAKLERQFPRIIGCRVVVDGPSAHHQTGGDYKVTLDLRLPGSEPLIVSRQPATELEAAINDSFQAARRRLDDYSQKLRGEVKPHG